MNPLRQFSDAELMAKYGMPNQEGSYLTSAKIPFNLKLAWDTPVTVNKIRCHKTEAQTITTIFTEILNYYGLEKIQALRIDLFGGCFSFRAMRGGTSWSRHSWGLAIDLDPDRNKLKETSKTARFARIEYKPMIDIFESHQWLSLGRLKNYDWMHFERGTI
jgi:hypothetical protein